MSGHAKAESLSLSLDAALSRAERRAVERHLEACPECRQRLDGLRRVVAGLGRLQSAAPPEDMADQLFRLAGFLGFSTRVAGRTQHRLETRLGVPMEALRGRDIARSLTNPLLVFHDRGDGIVPFRDGATLARYWPGACLIATEDLGHSRILRDPEALDRTVDFLSGRQAGQDTGCAQDVAA